MATIKCNKCNSEWNSNVAVEKCPFCGESMPTKNEKRFFEDVDQLFTFLISEYGVEIIRQRGKFYSMSADYAPSLNKELRLIKIALDSGVYEDLLNASGKDAATQKITYRKAVTKLENDHFLDLKWIEKVLGWLIVRLEWNYEENSNSNNSLVQIDINEVKKENVSNRIHEASTVKSNDKNGTQKNNTVDSSFIVVSGKYDSERYNHESENTNFVFACKAYDKDDYADAKRYYEIAYNSGNILAGICLGQMYFWGQGCSVDYNVANGLFTEGMNKGCALGAVWLAELYRTGKGVSKDKEKAKEIYNKHLKSLVEMCEYGSRDAQYFYGCDLLWGTYFEANKEQALYWLEKAMNSGSIRAGVEVAIMYLNGDGCKKDEIYAVNQLTKYSKGTNKKANYELGKLYYYGKVVKQDYEAALRFFKTAADAGHASSQDYIGDIFYYGKGVKINYGVAIKWYEKARSGGNKTASLGLGQIYYYGGHGVKKDTDKAFDFLKEAADNGISTAQFMLGYDYYFYDSQYKDYKLGKKYLEMSAEQDFTPAQVILARMYLSDGFGFADTERFVYWMRRAADNGDAEAQRIFGDSYINLGEPTILPKDYNKAKYYLEKAADQDDILACIKIANFYATVAEYKNIKRSDVYLKKAEKLISDKEKKYGSNLGDEKYELAGFYYKVYSDIDSKRKAIDLYLSAYEAGEKDGLYYASWIYFIDNIDITIDSIHCPESNKKGILIMSEKTFDSADLEELRLKSIERLTKEMLGDFTNKLIDDMVNSERNFGSSDIEYLLGLIYYNGYRVNEDKYEAEKWLIKAGNNGSLSALCKLVCYYINDRKDSVKGFRIAGEAHKKGSVEGTRLLGICYRDGIGTKKNRSEAKALLKEAASKGNSAAAEELKKFWF